MLDNVKNKVNDIKKGYEVKRAKRERIKKEQAEEVARKEAERIAAEQEKIKAEKDSLMKMSEKELVVEAVMALRGLYMRMTELEGEQESVLDRIEQLESDVSNLEYQVSNLNLNDNE